ncbi:MAG: ubiquitin-like domain-containing protein, partial [Oscillospiraceae bacterium]|nr:ubiquitin-like domain-containing protein [Oscillospiraceae bacterium]
ISVAAYSRTAVINDSGAQQEVVTTEVYTDDILNTADIKLGPDDEVVRTDNNGVIQIKIYRAFTVSIENAGQSCEIRIARGTVADALSAAGISYTDEDEITPAVTEPLKANMKIAINNSLSVTIKADGETNSYKVPYGTVEQALLAAEIDFNTDDIFTPEVSAPVREGMNITLQRVTFKDDVKGVTIDFEEERKETSDLAYGKTQIKTYGIDGYKEVVTTQKYIDGKLASTTKTEEIIEEPVTQVVLVGTKGANNGFYKEGNGSFTDDNGKTVKYKKKLVGCGTAYSGVKGDLTASGVPVYHGGVAVNPAIIPLGSKLYIVSNDGKYVYGYATAVDTGGALYAGDALVDLFYWSEDYCWEFGRRTCTVYVL